MEITEQFPALQAANVVMKASLAQRQPKSSTEHDDGTLDE
jgi:hypothetical protein